MTYNIMIITNKYYDEICDHLQRIYGRWTFKRSRDLSELWLGGISVTVRRNAAQARGYKSHIIYADEEILNDKKIYNNLLMPCVNLPGALGVKPLDKETLLFIFGVEEKKEIS